MTRPLPRIAMRSPALSWKLGEDIVFQLTRTSSPLIKSTILLRDIPKPKEAIASSLNEASVEVSSLVTGIRIFSSSNAIAFTLTGTVRT